MCHTRFSSFLDSDDDGKGEKLYGRGYILISPLSRSAEQFKSSTQNTSVRVVERMGMANGNC